MKTDNHQEYEDNGLYENKNVNIVLLPSDYMSDEEIESLSGECITVTPAREKITT